MEQTFQDPGMSSWRQIASSSPVITYKRKLRPGGMWVLANVTQGRAGQSRPLFCSLYLHSLDFFSHSFVPTFHSSGTSLSTYSMAKRPRGFRAESVAAPMLKSSEYSPGGQACVTICQVPSDKRGHGDPGGYQPCPDTLEEPQLDRKHKLPNSRPWRIICGFD